METNTEIVKVEPAMPSFFLNKDAFEHAQRVAIMLSNSDLVPATFKGKDKVGNCVIALNMANRIGADVLMVMQNLYVVHGKPAWSSQFLIATLNASGKFSPLRYEEEPDTDGGRCRAVATDKSTNEVCQGIWVSMNMAKEEGWSTKAGSKWKTMPQLMMRYRAATFFTRQFAPEVSMGLHSYEEVQDLGYADEVREEAKTETQTAVTTALDDLGKIKRNKDRRDQLAKIDAEMDTIQDMGCERYLTLTQEREELEKQIES